jgi:hypothetical protein
MYIAESNRCSKLMEGFAPKMVKDFGRAVDMCKWGGMGVGVGLGVNSFMT